MSELPSSRREWERYSLARQQELRENLADMEFLVDWWNLKIQDAVTGHEGEDHNALFAEAVTELDKAWKFSGHFLQVSGEWWMPTIENGPGSLVAKFEKRPALGTVASNGFIIRMDDESTAGDGLYYPRAGLSFRLQSGTRVDAAFQANVTFLAYAEMGALNMTYVRPNLEGVISSDLPELAQAIDSSDELLKLYTRDPDSYFYTLSSDEQADFLQSLVNRVDETMPSLEAFDTAHVQYARVPYIFQQDAESRQLKKITPQADHSVEVRGQLYGVTLPELILPRKSLGSYDDLMDREGGMCLVVEVEYANVDINPSDVVLVPVRNAHALSYLLK